MTLKDRKYLIVGNVRHWFGMNSGIVDQKQTADLSFPTLRCISAFRYKQNGFLVTSKRLYHTSSARTQKRPKTSQLCCDGVGVRRVKSKGDKDEKRWFCLTCFLNKLHTG